MGHRVVDTIDAVFGPPMPKFAVVFAPVDLVIVKLGGIAVGIPNMNKVTDLMVVLVSANEPSLV